MAKQVPKTKEKAPVKADDGPSKGTSNAKGKPTAPVKQEPEKRSISWFTLGVLFLGIVLTAIQDPEELKFKLGWIKDAVTGNLPPPAPRFTCREAHAHLTDVLPVKGFHVLCIEPTFFETLEVTAWKDGMLENRTAETEQDMNALRLELEDMLGIFRPSDENAVKYKQPYAFFTPEGERLEMELGALVRRVVYLFEGGQFIWPGIKVGHKRIVKDLFGKGDVEMETLSMTPLVFGVEEFLKDDEIDIILDLSLPHLKPSGVTLNDEHKDRPATDWRTSTTYFLPSSSHEVVQNIDRRTADLVKVPMTHQEFVQVLRYEKTQKYDHHLDSFSVERHQNNRELLESIHYGYKNRMITVFWYMSDVAKGGHTIFPRAGGLPQPTSMKDCTIGLKVPPKKRKVVVFYSMLPNGEIDPMSLHGGCPVEEGVKYSGNKWVWNKPRDDIKE